MNQPIQISDFSKHLFWDVNKDNICLEKHAAYVVQRVLEYGLMEDWILLKNHYGIPRIAEIAMGLRDLDPISANFIATLSGKPIEKFRCYILRQSQPKHWIY